GTTGSGCSSCGNGCSGGDCSSGSCAGGNCQEYEGTSISANFNETSGFYKASAAMGNCDATITLYTIPPRCGPCRELENNQTVEKAIASLTDYNITFNKVSQYGPKNYIPDLYVECKGASFQVRPITEASIRAAVLNNCQCQKTYNCDATQGCVEAGSDGEFQSYNECYTNCQAEKDKKQKYSCFALSGKCKQDDAGSYDTLLDCQTNCTTTGDMYACVSGTCVKDASGTYDNLLTCQLACED